LSSSDENPGFLIFETLDERLKIVCGDFYGLTVNILGGSIDCVWDRRSFVATDVSQREKYVETMRSILSDKFAYLLVTTDHRSSSVSVNDVIENFSPFCAVKVLEVSVDSVTGESCNSFLLSRKPIAAQERLNYWQSRWVSGDSNWHFQNPNEFLVRHLDLLKAGREHVRIFLPLCGKSVDLVWLYNQGHTVVGLEGVPFVAEEVFQDANLDYEKLFLPEIDGFVFKTPDERLTVYSCDFFNVDPQIIGQFEAVFDRGAFEAIDKKDRKAYTDLIFKLLAPKFRIILTGYEYDTDVYGGTPRNVDREEVYNLFGRQNPERPSRVSIVEEADFSEHGKQFNLKAMTKLIYHIQNKT
jgi:thiopurine S-methyltransferase